MCSSINKILTKKYSTCRMFKLFLSFKRNNRKKNVHSTVYRKFLKKCYFYFKHGSCTCIMFKPKIFQLKCKTYSPYTCTSFFEALNQDHLLCAGYFTIEIIHWKLTRLERCRSYCTLLKSQLWKQICRPEAQSFSRNLASNNNHLLHVHVYMLFYISAINESMKIWAQYVRIPPPLLLLPTVILRISYAVLSYEP